MKEYTPPPRGEQLEFGYNGDGPIYDSPLYKKNMTTEYERTLSLINTKANSILLNPSADISSALKEIVEISKNLIAKDIEQEIENEARRSSSSAISMAELC